MRKIIRSCINENNHWKTKILHRDKYTCCHCGYNKKLDVHHITPFKELFDNFLKKETNLLSKKREEIISIAKKYSPFWDIRNGITLCRKCHHSLLKNKTCLITGGTGSIAQTIKKILIQNNYILFSPSHLELDITNEQKVKTYIQNRRIDILINNAGYIKPQDIKNSTLKEFKKHINVNLYGIYNCSKYAMLNTNNILIINILSTSSFEGRKSWGFYCASKCAGLSLTETLVEEGIEAYSLNPSRTNTKMRKSLFPNEDPDTLMSPNRIGEFVLRILNKEFENGSHIIVTKEKYIIIPKRRCQK